jgi:hypothetical protein
MAALSLETLRDNIRTSIYGRRLGLDNTSDNVAGARQRGGFLVGFAGARLPIQAVTTTAASTLYPSGYIELATNPSTQAFAAPIPGAEVTVTQTATSTAGIQLRLTNGNFNTSTGSSANQITFWGLGASVRLAGLSTAIMAVISGLGQSTLQVSYSTF